MSYPFYDPSAPLTRRIAQLINWAAGGAQAARGQGGELREMASSIDLNPNDFNAVIKILAEEYSGDSGALIADLRRGQKSTKAQPVQPRTATELVLRPSARAKAMTRSRPASTPSRRSTTS